MTPENSGEAAAPVAWLRQVSPYFRRHRGRTFVVHLDGGTMQEAGFQNIVRDLILLAAVGIRLVVVYGARPQIDRRLAAHGIEPQVAGGLRVTDAATMLQVQEVVGGLRLAIEFRCRFFVETAHGQLIAPINRYDPLI